MEFIKFWNGKGENLKRKISASRNVLIKTVSSVAEGADPLFTSDHGNLIHAAVYSGNINIMDIVMKRGCDVDCVNQGGNTPLLLAVSQGNRAVCERLVTHGASLNVVDRFDETPLLRSVGNNTNVLRLLLQHGADCTITDARWIEPFFYFTWMKKNGNVILFNDALTTFVSGFMVLYANV